MSGFEGLSIASAIIQVIGFAVGTARLCKDVYDGRPTPSEHVAQNAASMKAAADQVEALCQKYPPETDGAKELEALAAKCSHTARELERKSRDILRHNHPGNVLKAALVVSKSWWEKRSIQKLQETLAEYTTTMETHILVRVCKRSDAISIQQQDTFRGLSEELKSFAAKFAAGETRLTSLITSENEATRKYTALRILEAETSIKEHVTTKTEEHNKRVASEAERKQLLRSVKYESLNHRRNQIHDSYDDTFHWIFESEESSGAPANSFPNWLASDGKIFWISGKPGSGKSTLMRFLLLNPKTATLLSDGSENPAMPCIITSHFFWKVGGGMMSSLKGMWLSLTHQVLSATPELSDYVLANFLSTSTKESNSDWSDTEIHNVCLAVIRKCAVKICIFIDGLDEVSDDVDKRRQAVKDLCQCPNVKLCIASRPEWRLEKWLDKYPLLRLQDLTRHDRETYARGELEPFVQDGLLGPELRDRLVESLVSKSMGVFLWIYLALQSVKTGLDNHDSPDDVLFARVDSLPSELEELYTALWDRLGKDSPHYRAKAARYFRLTLELPKHGNNLYQFTVLDLAMMENPALQNLVLDGSHKVDISDINHLCENVLLASRTHCLGLLETCHLGMYVYFGHPHNDYESVSLEFMHRTVHDFLSQTDAGQAILDYDPLPRKDLFVQVSRSMLAAGLSWYQTSSIKTRSVLSMLGEVFRDEPLTEELDGLLTLTSRHDLTGNHVQYHPTAAFIAICMCFFGVNNHPILSWVARHLEERGKDLVTEVLYCLCTKHSSLSRFERKWWESVNLIVRLGVDPFKTVGRPSQHRLNDRKNCFMLSLLSDSDLSYDAGFQESTRLRLLLSMLSGCSETPNERITLAVYMNSEGICVYDDSTFYRGHKTPLPDDMPLEVFTPPNRMASTKSEGDQRVGVMLELNMAFWIHMYHLTLLNIYNNRCDLIGSTNLSTWPDIPPLLEALKPYGNNYSGRIVHAMYESRRHYHILEMINPDVSDQLIGDWIENVQKEYFPTWLPYPRTLLSAVLPLLEDKQIFERSEVDEHRIRR